MPSPFPGFDPYLENPNYWRGFHNNFLAYINESLNAQLPPGFAANTEERIYLVQPERLLYPDVALFSRPPASPWEAPRSGGAATLVADTPISLTLMDETIYEPYIEVLALGAEEKIVTVIELLSPTNKTIDGHGRDSYVRKQEQILQSDVHLLEIDLLRDGIHTIAAPRDILRKKGGFWDYLVCLHRGNVQRNFECWPVPLSSRLPRVSVPLTDEYPDVTLDLQGCFERTYDAGPYRRRVDYRAEPTPPLSGDNAGWADALLKEKGLR